MSNDLLHILLIEDNAGDRVLLEESLSAAAMPVEITWAGSLAEARSLAAANSFELVLLDLTLPDSQGLDTVKAAVDTFPALPIIVLTGRSGDETGNDALRTGAQDYLHKGHITPEVLRRSIRYAMERQTAQQALLRARNHLEEQVQQRTAELATTVQELEHQVRERLSAEEELRRANQFMRMVNDCNQALVRIEDEATLMQLICQIILDVGGYKMAWVGYSENDAGKSVRPVASVGFDEDYLANAQITWADSERGRGPTGMAIRLGKPFVGSNFLVDPELAPWRAQALKRGFRSSIALPLKAGGHVFGALTIYASEACSFGETEKGVLASLADDLAFGITALRTRADLRESRQRPPADRPLRSRDHLGRGCTRLLHACRRQA